MPIVNPSSKSKWFETALAAICLVALLSGVGFADDDVPPAPLRVTAGTIDGKTIEGTLVAVSADGVEIATGEGADSPRVKLSAAALTSVSVVDKRESAEHPVLAVSLVDGSLLAATVFRVHDGVATVVSAGGEATAVATRRINWVRFRAPTGDDTFASEWNEIVGQTSTEPTPRAANAGAKVSAAADVLVIRKKSALDYLEGVAGQVDDESVVFEVDHDPVTVKRAKVEGVIYYHAKKGELADAAAVVADRSGSRLEIVSAALDGDRLKLTTPAGQEIVLPAADLERLDYSSASTQLLGDLEPESFQYVSYFGGKDQPPSVAEFYKPRRDSSFDQLPLRVAGKTFAKGLSLHARTKVVYRLPGKFSRLSAVVGIDDSVRDAGDVRLEIRGDGKMLWEESVRGTDAPRLLDVSVQGVKRLEIVADFGGDFDAGDVIDLCDAKVTR